jgi:hypothetical protein
MPEGDPERDVRCPDISASASNAFPAIGAKRTTLQAASNVALDPNSFGQSVH